MKRVEHFKTEAELCAAFIADAKSKGYVPYAETEGWDILLVAADGTQVGIQAKLKFNMKLLAQAMEQSWAIHHAIGPDFRAVLLPHWDHQAADILNALGLGYVRANVSLGGRKVGFEPDLRSQFNYGMPWHFWNPEQRHKLPSYIPDVVAGASGPIQLTRWKIGALQITAVLEKRGFVTRQDFKRYGVDHRRWVGYGGWLDAGAELGQYVRNSTLNFDKQHPTVYAQVVADLEKEIAAGFHLMPQGALV